MSEDDVRDEILRESIEKKFRKESRVFARYCWIMKESFIKEGFSPKEAIGLVKAVTVAQNFKINGRTN